MSNPNFVSDLVAMAKAFEELPTVKEKLDATQHEADAYARMVSEREESILRLKAEIDALHAKVRDTEAQRDDAELRFLDSEDRTKQALNFIRSTFGSAGSLIQALEPPAPVEPVKAAEPIPTPPAEPEHAYEAPPQGWGEPLPTDAPTQGQSEPLPSTVATSQAPAEPSVNSGVTQSETVTSSGTTQLGEGVAAAPVDPTHGDTNTTASTQSSGSGAQSETASISVDDVGYHNEPTVGTGPDAWTEWDKWQHRMNQRYPAGWPTRIVHPTH